MLFKQKHLDGIKAGTISLAFRKWNKASVKKGSLLKTAIGVVEVVDIAQVEKITPADAVKAGFNTPDEVLETFTQYPDGDLYKIKVRYYSEDPRIGLREKSSLTQEEFAALKEKVQKLGPWTKDVLLLIKAHPKLRAIELAGYTGKEKEWLKLNVRKLKNLGLTISFHPGYTLSPLGEAYVKKL